MIHQSKREQWLDCTLDEAWKFFSTPRNLEQLTPASIRFRITHLNSESAHIGQIIGYRIRIAPMIEVPWLTELTVVEPRQRFVDDQRSGPYKVWHHEHTFEEMNGGVLMRDTVTYVLPFGPIGDIVHKLFVGRKLRFIFDERYRLCDEIFNHKSANGALHSRSAGVSPV